jgi:RNA polymerase sigma factor (TIGR02999 family)
MAPNDGTFAYDETFSAAYDELRRLAHKLKRGHGNPTLNPTALVHEAYIKLAGAKSLNIESPQHLKYTVTRAMKYVLLDAARRKAADVRGGGDIPLRRVALDDNAAQSAAVDPREFLAVGAALQELAFQNEFQARVFELQFFGGLQVAEIAELMGLSEKKVQRVLRLAKAFLALALDRSRRAAENHYELGAPPANRRIV